MITDNRTQRAARIWPLDPRAGERSWRRELPAQIELESTAAASIPATGKASASAILRLARVPMPVVGYGIQYGDAYHFRT